MVSFICDSCQETVKKPAVAKHLWKCPQTTLSCVDCSHTFDHVGYNQHNSCISEAEKYQGKLFKGKKLGGNVPAGSQASKMSDSQASGSRNGANNRNTEKTTPSAPKPVVEEPKPEEGESSVAKPKWKSSIRKTLKQNEGQLSKKKLQKVVCAEMAKAFPALSQDDLKEKFEKKLASSKRYKVVGDSVTTSTS